MPPRPPKGLDEISRMLGELSAYVHEGRHGVNNLSTKFDALALDIAKRVEGMKAELSVRLDAMDKRLTDLEATNAKEAGARGVVGWIIQSPVIGWLVAAALFVAAWWKGDGRP